MSSPLTAARPAQPIKLYTFALSGHCHRVHLFASLLGLPLELVPVDFMAKAHKAPEFLAMNPFGQVPVIQDGALTLSDSNAILVYLAGQYGGPQWLPHDPAQAAAVQRWLSVAAGQLAYGPGNARLVVLLKAPFNPDEVVGRAHALLAVMEQTLEATPFLVGHAPTIADIANYTYTLLAPEGNVSLDAYPAVRAWLARIEALPGFVPMKRMPVGLNAPAKPA